MELESLPTIIYMGKFIYIETIKICLSLFTDTSIYRYGDY